MIFRWRLHASCDALIFGFSQGENFATVDLFDIDHAAKVLTKFGQAFGKLPANAGNLSADEQQFISQVAKGLAQEGKVVSVRLSLFADMVKGKSWKPAHAWSKWAVRRELASTFWRKPLAVAKPIRVIACTRSPPEACCAPCCRNWAPTSKATCARTLNCLNASGYQDQPADFADLLRILDGELRLITPTDPEGHDSQSKSDSNTQYYQLTHDYLVPSLREWLTRKQKETRRGRAELKLAERTALWNVKK